MAEEATKTEQPTVEHTEAATTGTAAADVVASAKVFVETVQASVLKQGDKVRAKVVGAANDTKTSAMERGVSVKDRVVGTANDTKTSATEQGVNVKDKVIGAVGNMLEATKNGVVKCVDSAQGYLKPPPPTSATTDPASPATVEDKKE